MRSTQFSKLPNESSFRIFPQKLRLDLRKSLQFSIKLQHLQDWYSRANLTSRENKQRHPFTRLPRVVLTQPRLSTTPNITPRTYFFDQCFYPLLVISLLAVFRLISSTILREMAGRVLLFQHDSLLSVQPSTLRIKISEILLPIWSSQPFLLSWRVYLNTFHSWKRKFTLFWLSWIATCWVWAKWANLLNWRHLWINLLTLVPSTVFVDGLWAVHLLFLILVSLISLRLQAVFICLQRIYVDLCIKKKNLLHFEISATEHLTLRGFSFWKAFCMNISWYGFVFKEQTFLGNFLYLK